MPLQGAIVVWFGGEGDDQLWCHCRVPNVLSWGKGRVTTNFAGCHCSVPSWGKGRVTANFGGVDVVPLQGAIVVCYGLGGG